MRDEPNTPTCTTPWRDDELIWWRGVPYCYLVSRGEIARVYLAGGLSLSWGVFRLAYPGVNPPRTVRA